jgi:hypothetical protein
LFFFCITAKSENDFCCWLCWFCVIHNIFLPHYCLLFNLLLSSSFSVMRSGVGFVVGWIVAPFARWWWFNAPFVCGCVLDVCTNSKSLWMSSCRVLWIDFRWVWVWLSFFHSFCACIFDFYTWLKWSLSVKVWCVVFDYYYWLISRHWTDWLCLRWFLFCTVKIHVCHSQVPLVSHSYSGSLQQTSETWFCLVISVFPFIQLHLFLPPPTSYDESCDEMLCLPFFLFFVFPHHHFDFISVSCVRRCAFDWRALLCLAASGIVRCTLSLACTANRYYYICFKMHCLGICISFIILHPNVSQCVSHFWVDTICFIFLFFSNCHRAQAIPPSCCVTQQPHRLHLKFR